MLNVESSGYLLRKIGITVLVALTCFSFSLPAQSPRARHVPGRYLFIVETSAAMRNRSDAVQKAMSTLLLSRMNGQLQWGDSIGVWTYNEKLYAGHLPVQEWIPETEKRVATNILTFLATQPFEKKSSFDVVEPELQRLVKESEKLTVLLISDGHGGISGTPFDSKVNEFFKKNARKQKRERMPFITVFRSYRGKFAGVTMILAPWPVEFPAFPPEAMVAAERQPKPPPKKRTPRTTAPPLIVIGKKPTPEPVAPTNVAKTVVPTNAAATSVTEESLVETATASNTMPTEVASATESSAPLVAPTAASHTAAPEATTETESPKPTPAPVAATPETKPAAVNPAPTPTSPAASAEALKPEAAPPAEQVATATEPQTIFSRTNLVLMSLGLLVLAAVIFFLLQRRARRNARISLITRSMDQDQK